MSQRERGREVAHRGEERRALLGTPSIHLCQTLLYEGVYIGGLGVGDTSILHHYFIS
jgi:hypothetical protein